jgi:hypothetical protein
LLLELEQAGEPGACLTTKGLLKNNYRF